MRVLHASPERYDHRRQLRRSIMPDLLPFRSKPTVPAVTTSEVSDADIGLPEDSIAQANAEQFVRAALSFKRHQALKAEKLKRTFTPSSILIALPAEEDDEIEEVQDVATVLAERVKPLSFEDLQ